MRWPALLSLVATLAGAGDRTDLVAIMDGGRADDPFYRAARDYYLAADARVVTGFGTLAELRDAVARVAAETGRPIGELRVVVHGSEWTGLAVKVDGRGEDVRPDTIAEAVAEAGFAPLPETVLDSRSTVVLESCGVGRRPRFLDDLSRLLGGVDAERPLVQGSREFVTFRAGNGPPTRHERGYVSVIVRETLDRDAAAIGAAFARRYPQVDGIAARAAQALSTDDGLDIVPIRFRVTVPDRGELAQAGGPAAWAAKQPALGERLASVGLTVRQLDWTQEDGAVVGRATLVTLADPQ